MSNTATYNRSIIPSSKAKITNKTFYFFVSSFFKLNPISNLVLNFRFIKFSNQIALTELKIFSLKKICQLAPV